MKHHETEGRSLFSCEAVTHRLCNHWLTEVFEKKKMMGVVQILCGFRPCPHE